MKREKKHSREGWDYKKVASIIENINELFKKAKITFVEEKVVLNWFECNLIYEMGILSAKTFTQSENFKEVLDQLNNIPVDHDKFKGQYIQ